MTLCRDCLAKSMCSAYAFFKEKSDDITITVNRCYLYARINKNTIKEDNKISASTTKTCSSPRVEMSNIFVDDEEIENNTDSIIELISDKKVSTPPSNVIMAKDEFLQTHPDMVKCCVCETLIPKNVSKELKGKIYCAECFSKQFSSNGKVTKIT